MLEELTKLYDAYVDTFREADGKLPVMMQLKRAHTGFVVKNAELIADGEGFTDEEREVSLAAALLHDTCRRRRRRAWSAPQAWIFSFAAATFFFSSSLWSWNFLRRSASAVPRIWTASRAAFVGPALPQATVATGTPLGICTVA